MTIQSIKILGISLIISSSVFAQGWKLNQKLVANDRSLNDQFAYSADLDGNAAIVGAYWEDHNSTGLDSLSNAGSAYVLIKTNDSWSIEQKIVGSNRGKSEYFGNAVAISDSFLIVGAYNQNYDADGKNYKYDAGAVYIFEKINGIWTEVINAVASDRDQDDDFGYSVSISGNYAIVGAPQEDEDENDANSMSNAGSSYIFERGQNGIWTQVQKIVASDRTASDKFGTSVSISGNYAVIGAKGDNEDENGGNSLSGAGSAYIFERGQNGIWTEVDKIVGEYRGVFYSFGGNVSIDSNYIAVGARGEGLDLNGQNNISQSGAAYIFKRNNSNVWERQQRLIASDRQSNDFFGNSIDITDSTVIIGALQASLDSLGSNVVNGAGAAYVFARNTNEAWSQTSKLVANDREEYDYFSNAVAISGKDILVGANYNKTDETGNQSLEKAGSIYLYSRIKNDQTTSIDYGTLNPNFEVYPNPAKNSISINFGEKTPNSMVQLVDIHGKLLETQNVKNTIIYQMALDYPSGIYFLKIKNRESLSSTKIIIR